MKRLISIFLILVLRLGAQDIETETEREYIRVIAKGDYPLELGFSTPIENGGTWFSVSINGITKKFCISQNEHANSRAIYEGAWHSKTEGAKRLNRKSAEDLVERILGILEDHHGTRRFNEIRADLAAKRSTPRSEAVNRRVTEAPDFKEAFATIIILEAIRAYRESHAEQVVPPKSDRAGG